MKDINCDNRQIIKTMQDQIDCLMEFIDIQGEILEEKTGCRQSKFFSNFVRITVWKFKKSGNGMSNKTVSGAIPFLVL